MDYRHKEEVKKRVLPILERIKKRGVDGTTEDIKAICEAILFITDADYTNYDQGCGR